MRTRYRAHALAALALLLVLPVSGSWAQTSVETEVTAAAYPNREALEAAMFERATSPEVREKAAALQAALQEREKAVAALPEVKRIDEELARLEARLIELTRRRMEVTAENEQALAAVDAAVKEADEALAEAEGREVFEAELRRLSLEEEAATAEP